MDEMERKKRFLINAAYVVSCFVIFYVIIRYAMYALMPFTIALVVTSILKRPIDRVSGLLHAKRKWVALIIVVLFYALIASVLVYGITQAVVAIVNWFTSLDTLYQRSIEPVLNNIFETYENLVSNINPEIESNVKLISDQILSSLAGFVTKISSRFVSIAQSLIISTPALFIAMIFCIVSTVFISIDYYNIVYFILAQFSERQQKVIVDGKNYLVGSIGGIIKSYGIIMLITMCELFVGLRFIGVQNAGTLAMLIGIFDILPALGTGGIMVPWGVIVLLGGNYVKGIQLLALYGIITVIRNIIEPKIVGETTGLHPVLLLISIYIGGTIFGPFGVIIMPFSLIVLKKLNDSGLINLFRSDYLGEKDKEYQESYRTNVPIKRKEKTPPSEDENTETNE